MHWQCDTSSLFKEVRKGSGAGINRHIDAGVSVDGRNHRGYTPLDFAVWHRKVEAVRVLLARGADPTLRSNIESDADPTDASEEVTPIITAGRCGTAEITALLLDSLRARGCPEKANVQGSRGNTALHRLASLAKGDYMDRLTLLLAQPEIDLSITTSRGETAEDVALRHEHMDVAERLKLVSGQHLRLSPALPAPQ